MSDPFARFTDRTRKVMLLAAEEAFNFGHTFIGSEHILLGIYREGTAVAVELLNKAGLTEANLRGEIENLLRAVGPAGNGHFHLTYHARQALSIAAGFTTSDAPRRIDSDHLVLGMLKQQSGIVDQVFINFGIKRLELAKQIRFRLELEDESHPGEE